MQYQDARERGSRRRRLAAMANNVYRAGVAAASEIRDQYNTARAMRDSDGSGSDGDEDRPPNIPGAFPDVSFATGGDAQMVLFPMYAKRHVRRFRPRAQPQMGGALPQPPDDSSDSGDGTGPWRRPSETPDWSEEFARLEDEKAVVDVYVHGWLYRENKGPLSRKSRLLIGLARRLTGIPAPGQWAPVTVGADVPTEAGAEDPREAIRIQRAAEAIERRGQGEKEVASRGGYSETPETAASYDDSSSDEGASGRRGQPQRASAGLSGYGTPEPPGPGKLAPKTSWTAPLASSVAGAAAPEMTEAELIAANTNLLARIGPFLTTPVEEQPVTLFFYNETQSQSRTTTTSDAGHFSVCVALDFVPTHVRVLVSSGAEAGSRGAGGVPSLASEVALANNLTHPLSAVAAIELVEDRGISLISDIDDTVKASNIALGTREIFRNTFLRDLAAMAVEGTREWYTTLHALGVQFHYCSNSPWQLFPMLTTFFKATGLPRGPLHLKQYSGMLQGIFEPVAERKRGTLEKILRDFPHRRFLLVGDSGEADLEVYTELVLAHPGRVLAIFIRDVTTPARPGYFDAAASMRSLDLGADARRPSLPPRLASAPPQAPAPADGPVMGTLIDLAEDGPPLPPSSVPSLPATGLPTRKPRPPPRPTKPMALRSSLAAAGSATSTPSSPTTPSPLANASRSTPPPPPPPPPPPRRRTPAADLDSSSTSTSAADTASAWLPRTQPPLQSFQQPTQNQQTPMGTPPGAPLNKKVDMWQRRLAHAQAVLGPQGVALYTWRRGQDVAVEAVGIVKDALRGKR